MPQKPPNLSVLLEFILNQKSLKPHSWCLLQISAIYNIRFHRVRRTQHSKANILRRYLT